MIARHTLSRFIMVMSLSLTAPAWGQDPAHRQPTNQQVEETALGELSVDQCLHHHLEGQRLRRDGSLLAAQAEWISCQHDSCNQLVREDCANLASQVEAEIPSISVIASLEGQLLPEVEVYEHGSKLAELTRQGVLRLDPGVHQLTFTTPSAPPVVRTITLRAQQTMVPLEVSFEPLPVTSRTDQPTTSGAGPTSIEAAPTTLLPPEATTDEATFHETTADDASSNLGAVDVVLLSAGGALMASGLGLAIYSYSESEHAKTECAPLCDESEVQRLRTLAIIGDVLTGVGLVSIAVAVVRITTRKPEATPSLAIGVGPGSISAYGRF